MLWVVDESVLVLEEDVLICNRSRVLVMHLGRHALVHDGATELVELAVGFVAECGDGLVLLLD